VLPVLSAAEMRAVDRRAIEQLGLPGSSLMEQAGRGAAQAVMRFLQERGTRRGARVAILCGKGGNGGDGFVVARWLKRRGHRPTVWLAFPPAEIGGDAGMKLAELRRAGIRPAPADDPAAVPLAEADVVVDALLGTGSRGAPTGLVARLIEAMNAAGRPVVALDIPSGLPADGGPPPGPAVRAVLTPTFAGLKRGLVTGAGVDHAGRVEVVPIGVPPEEVARGVTTFLLEPADVAGLVPPRARGAHKGTFGHLLVVAGSLGKTGAAALAAHGALRSGAGLVTVATAASQQPIVAALLLEAMTAALPETAAQSAGLEARKPLLDLVAGRDAVALGPGLGLDPDTQALARALIRDVERPMVVDADGLTAVAGHLDLLREARGPRCLTPHPGELARLLETTVADVERDRIETARAFARGHRVHLVLKGAGSVIAIPTGEVYVSPTGNPGMASGGTGDVLTGIIGAFLARRLPPPAALQLAVFLHGRAGDLAVTRLGEESMIAGDLVAALPEAFRSLASGPR
jgi:NAD(P)H-hydrate epimerase